MTHKFMIPADFSADMKIREAAEKYKVCQTTIKRWRSIVMSGGGEEYNQKIRSKLRFGDEKAEIDMCLNCTKYKCLGYCDKFPR